VFGYSLVGGVGAVTTFVVTFLMRRLAPRIGALSLPGHRSVHADPTPSLGGAGMFIGFLAAMAVASQLNQFREMFADSSEPLGLLLAAAVMFLTGAVDDLARCPRRRRLPGRC